MSKRILVIDDDRYIRELYEEVLKNAGYTAEICLDGEEGFKKLQQGGYDLILLDKIMPKMDGMAILAALAKNPPQQKNGPIILLTNATTDIDDEKPDPQIALRLVKVDITPQDLVSEVKKLLQDTTPAA